MQYIMTEKSIFCLFVHKPICHFILIITVVAARGVQTKWFIIFAKVNFCKCYL